MDRERFKAILAAYGADPRRWPEHEREAAQAFAAQAGPALREAQAIDALLNLAPAPAPPSELLVARLTRSARRGIDIRPLLALAACAVFGLLVGVNAGLNASPEGEIDQVLASTFEAPAWSWMEEDS